VFIQCTESGQIKAGFYIPICVSGSKVISNDIVLKAATIARDNHCRLYGGEWRVIIKATYEEMARLRRELAPKAEPFKPVKAKTAEHLFDMPVNKMAVRPIYQQMYDLDNAPAAVDVTAKPSTPPEFIETEITF
jgi:hypothetical protein